MAKAKRQQFPLRIIQSNLRYLMPLNKFLEDMAGLRRLNPDLLCLNEVAHRRIPLDVWAKAAEMHVFQPVGPGEQGGTALFAKRSRFVVLKTVSEAMTGEPPGAPTKRYAACMFLFDRVSNCFIVYIGTHTVAAVERSGRLNPILRTPFYVAHIFNLITFAVRMRRVCHKEFGGWGQVVMSGDLNWNWSGPSAWINKTLGSYLTACHVALPRVPTLGNRAVDVVLKRASMISFLRQFTQKQNSDHDALIVDCRIARVGLPEWVRSNPSVVR